MKQFILNLKRKKIMIPVLCVVLCTLLLAGCGRSLVITTGFGKGQVFRLGKTRGKTGELRVYMLDLQKESENLYGDAIWMSADSEKMQEAVKSQALARLTRVKALGQMAISRDVMLTNLEEDLAQQAEKNYFAGLSEEEKKYLDLSEKELLNIMKEYALAARMWYSLGDSAEETYEEYYSGTQCDLNTKLWQKITLKKVEGDPAAPGFGQCYREMFAGVEYPASFENSGSGTTSAAGEEPEDLTEDSEESEDDEDEDDEDDEDEEDDAQEAGDAEKESADKERESVDKGKESESADKEKESADKEKKSESADKGKESADKSEKTDKKKEASEESPE